MALQSSCISREDLSGRVSYNVFSSRHNHIKKTSRDAGDRKSLYTCSIHIIVQIVRMFWRKSNRQTLKTKGAGIELYYFTLILHHYDAEEILTTGILAWEKSWHFATLPLASQQKEIWGMSAEIPYGWPFNSQIWGALLISWWFASANQKHIISVEFLRFLLRRHFAGKPVAASRKVGCFFKLKEFMSS